VVSLDWTRGAEWETVDDPAWETIRAAIEALNNGDRSYLALTDDPRSMMTIGAGPSRFLVTIERWDVPAGNDDIIWTATDRSARHKWSNVTLGGQESRLCDRYLVALDVALRAAATYANTGTTDPTIAWELAGDPTWVEEHESPHE